MTRMLYRKRRLPRMWRARQKLQPPSINIIYQKLQGRSWKFWSHISDHFREKRSQGSVQEVQQKPEAVHPMRFIELWRRPCSGQRLKITQNCFKHINTHSTINGIRERTDHNNDLNWEYYTICLKNINTTAKLNQYLWANMGTVLHRNPELIGRRNMIYQTVYNLLLPLDVHQGHHV